MEKIKKIQCSSCGATSVFKVSPNEYKCNYCQTTFRVHEGTQKNHASEVLERWKQQNVGKQPSSAGRLGCMILSAVLILTGGIIAYVVTASKSQIKGGFTSVVSNWQEARISKYITFAGSKGPVTWMILEQSGTRLDSARHFLRIVDPQTKKVLVEKPFGETTTWNDNFNFSKRLGYDYLLVNDTLYNGSEEGGLQAFDLYSGKRILTNADFEKKFPQLKDGIASVESRVYNKEFIFNTNGGDEFHYFPARHLLRDKIAERDAYKTDAKLRSNFYLTDNKKSQLYYISKKEAHSEISTIPDYFVERFVKDKYYNSQFKKLERVTDRYFPCAQRLLGDSSFVVIAYLKDFSKNANVIIEKLDAGGNTLWQNSDPAFAFFVKDFSSDHLYLNYNYSPSQIVFYNSNAEHRSIGIDLKTGKTTFVHEQGYNVK